MAPQRNKRSTKRVKDDDDDDFDPTQNTALLTKLFTAGQDQKFKRANQSFRSEGRAVLDDVAKELERAVEAYQGKQDAFEASVIATQRSLEETPSWTPLIVKAMSTAKVSLPLCAQHGAKDSVGLHARPISAHPVASRRIRRRPRSLRRRVHRDE
jgi:hypothetical protein